jgi:predicted RNase H-like nuclease (RuvC/YqgF family)
VLRGGELRVENENFKSEIRDCKATIEQLEEENDDLQSELETSEEKVERLEQELANLKKLFRSGS